jgi:hypothetical protein
LLKQRLKYEFGTCQNKTSTIEPILTDKKKASAATNFFGCIRFALFDAVLLRVLVEKLQFPLIVEVTVATEKSHS